jgi:hypothetical protein
VKWGNWQLVVSQHPPLLRNEEYSDITLDSEGGMDCDSPGYFWGISGSILDVYADEQHEKGEGFDYVQLDNLLAALRAIAHHGYKKGILTPAEAAYSYAAEHMTNNVAQ